MIIKYLLIILFHFICLPNKLIVPQPKIEKILGVNGHPLVQEAYLGNQNLQIKLIRELGINYYRVDIPLKLNYSISEKEQYSNTFTNFASSRINLIPVLINSEVITGLPINDVYNKAYNQGILFTKIWGKFFKYYEIENEVDNKTILGSQFTGEEINQYDTNKVRIQLAYLKGIINGIKKNCPNTKSIINISYLHTGFLKILSLNHVKYDIIGMHWYSDMGNLYPISVNGITEKVAKTFKKKIWLTEFNLRKTYPDLLPNEDISWWIKNFEFLVHNKNIEGIFIYELFDEPAFANANAKYNAPNEANYGLLFWDKRYTKYKYKSIFNLVKQQFKLFHKSFKL